MSCVKNNCKKYANMQSAYYDEKNNQIDYGININMKALGVSDGTDKQINPLIYKDNYKCGLGAAGANPCNKIEGFSSNLNGYNITNIVVIVLICFFILLFFFIIFNPENFENNTIETK